MRTFSIFLLASILLACGSTEDVISNTPDQESSRENVKIKAEIIEGETIQSDWFSVDTAYINKNRLFVTISYSGGCAEHTYRAVGSNVISKSIPPKRGLKLVHDAHDDSCRGMYQQTIEIDITDLHVPNPKNETAIQLSGWKETLIYKVKE